MQSRIKKSAAIKASLKQLPLMEVLSSAEGTVDERRVVYSHAIASAVMAFWETKVLPFLTQYAATPYGPEREKLIEKPLLLPAELANEFQCSVVTPACLVMDQMNMYLPVHHIGTYPAAPSAAASGAAPSVPTEAATDQRYGDVIATEVWQLLIKSTRGSLEFVKAIRKVAKDAAQGIADSVDQDQDAYTEVEEMRMVYSVARSFFALCGPLVDAAQTSKVTTTTIGYGGASSSSTKLGISQDSICKGILEIFKSQLDIPTEGPLIMFALFHRVAQFRNQHLPAHLARADDADTFSKPEVASHLAYLKSCFAEYANLGTGPKTEKEATILGELELNCASQGQDYYGSIMNDATRQLTQAAGGGGGSETASAFGVGCSGCAAVDSADCTSTFALSGVQQTCHRIRVDHPGLNVPRSATTFNTFGDRCKHFETKIGSALFGTSKARTAMTEACGKTLSDSSFFSEMVLPELMHPETGVLANLRLSFDAKDSLKGVNRCKILYKVASTSQDVMLPVIAKIVVHEFCLDPTVLKAHFLAPGKYGEFITNPKHASRPRRSFSTELPFTREEAAFTLIPKWDSFIKSTVLSKCFADPSLLRTAVNAELKAMVESPMPEVLSQILDSHFPRLCHSPDMVGQAINATTQAVANEKEAAPVDDGNSTAATLAEILIPATPKTTKGWSGRDHPFLTKANGYFTFTRRKEGHHSVVLPLDSMTWADEAAMGHRVWMHPDLGPKIVLHLEELYSTISDCTSKLYTLYGSKIPQTYEAKGRSGGAHGVWGGPRSFMANCTANWGRTCYARIGCQTTFQVWAGANNVTPVTSAQIKFGASGQPFETEFKKVMKKTYMSGNNMTDHCKDAVAVGVLKKAAGDATAVMLGDPVTAK